MECALEHGHMTTGMQCHMHMCNGANNNGGAKSTVGITNINLTSPCFIYLYIYTHTHTHSTLPQMHTFMTD